MKGRPSPVRPTLLLFSLACLCAAAAPARRAHAQVESAAAESHGPQAGGTRKIDEYGKVGHCDETARLDNFAIELQNEPGAKGYLVVYVGKNDLPSWTEGIKRRAASYLVNSRGLNAERVVVIDGGYREERTTELWFVPENGTPPRPSDAVDFKLDRTKAYQWDEDSFQVSFEPDDTEPAAADDADDSDAEEAEGEAVAADEAAVAQADAEFAAMEAEAAKYQIEVVAHGLIEDEPQPEEPEADKTEAGAVGDTAAGVEAAAVPESEPVYGQIKVGLWWNVGRLAEELKAVPDARVCLVYYWGLKNATQERAKQIVERAVAKTEEQLGVKRDRIIVIDGGRSYDPGVELWVVPPGAQTPKPSPGQGRKFGFYTMPGED